MKRTRLSPALRGEPVACIFCGFAVIKGLNTAMRAGPAGDRYHVNRDVCEALQKDEQLRKEVIKLHGEPASVSTGE